ncbi:ZZ-type zinc finger-containing protein 3 [Condylostylus longicornis]|uniref:ZZ-type zinc finger-containing protein 3 n=1 Tax=Condylostylus longicornis TaxID=2530218 RepID=UPI00244E118B|nr:ZZ-type zinc finger-containing protein 3 [Condylostylus longicornis]
MIENEESDIDNEEFYFESDHLALRGNSDYTSVLRTLIVLEAQRVQAAKDLEELAEIRKKALDDPILFVQSLSKNEIEFPKSINIAEIPNINFEKYNVKFPELNNINSTRTGNNTTENLEAIFKEEKHDTFNQHWTTEEQRRLEELLVEYPPEQYEMRRFAKISRALGNRTTKQVASRVQKYFKKLHAAGLPVPGRIPKARNLQKVSKYSKITFRPSTFFPSYNVPVCIPEDDDIGEPTLNTMSTNTSVKSLEIESTPNLSNSNEYDVDSSDSDDENDIKDEDNDQFKILKLLERVKKDKENDNEQRSNSIHYNYKCNYCSEEPILGTRWHCKTCTKESIDFCSDCLITQLMSTTPHPVQHKFRGIRVSNENQYDNEVGDYIDSDGGNSQQIDTIDKDYLLSKFSKDQKYNYLDPNFIS